MTLSRFVKSLLYTGAAAVLTALSVYYQQMLHAPQGPEEGYFAVHRVTRKQKRHRIDSLILLMTGVLLMAATLALWIGFGGVQEPFDSAGYTAVNIQIACLTVLPLPFWVRGLVLACTTHEDSRAKRLGAKLFSLAVAIVLVVLVAAGGVMRMMYYEDDGSSTQDGRPAQSQQTESTT